MARLYTSEARSYQCTFRSMFWSDLSRCRMYVTMTPEQICIAFRKSTAACVQLFGVHGKEAHAECATPIHDIHLLVIILVECLSQVRVSSNKQCDQNTPPAHPSQLFKRATSAVNKLQPCVPGQATSACRCDALPATLEILQGDDKPATCLQLSMQFASPCQWQNFGMKCRLNYPSV
jgi:hypothetical protein